MAPIKIILVEDHSLMREGIKLSLEQNPEIEIVGEAEDGEQALIIINSLRPDVVLIDIHLPGINGIEVVRQMKEISPNTKALILSAYDNDEYILALMEAGASGYLLKNIKTQELIDSIRKVYLGEPVLHSIVAAKVARLWANLGNKHQLVGRMSAREMEVLRFAVKGLRNKYIADELGISIRTVEAHFNSIYNKLDVSSRMEAVIYAISHQLFNEET